MSVYDYLVRIPPKVIFGVLILAAIAVIFYAGRQTVFDNNSAKPVAAALDKANTGTPDNPERAGAAAVTINENAVYAVKAGQVSAQTIVGGTIIPAREVTLTAQYSGQVTFLGGREGDRFNTDTVLVSINADDLVARRQAAVAQLQNAQAEINNAQVQYQRELLSPQSRSLSKSGGMGMPMMFDQMFGRTFGNLLPDNIGGDTVVDRNADLHSVGTQVNRAQNRYLQAKSQIDEIDARIADSRINTPFPGIILNKMVETGDIVQAGAPLLKYADLSRLQLEAQVPTSIVPRLTANMILPVRLGDDDYEIHARVEQIFPTADARRRTVTVKLDLPANSAAIPGMYAELLLPGERNEQAVPVIPLKLVMFNGSLPTVQVLTEDRQLQVRMIRLGEHMADKQVAVISGLKVGERIIDPARR
ncbi:MAG: efflux RND transporter periplasmic adaptor subunit [Thiolinea sp.]